MTQKKIDKEFTRQAQLFEEEVRNGINTDGNIKFKDFTDRWLVEYAEKNLAFSTYSRYLEILKRIIPAIGHIKLKDLKPMHLNAFYRNLSEPGISMKKYYDPDGNLKNNGCFSAKTIMEHHRLISIIFNTAIRWQLIENNVAERADPPRVPHKEIDCYDEHEARKLITILEGNSNEQFKVMIKLILFTGLRRGEVCGLEWEDIDFNDKSLRVSRSSEYIGKKITRDKDPKTQAGRRMMILNESAVNMLAEYKSWHDGMKKSLVDKWEEHNKLFTKWNGEPIHPDTLTAWFSDFLKANSLRHVTLHSLRHTNASLLIAAGTDVRTVSNRLGHAQTSTTLNLYTHALKSKDVEAADNLEIILRKAEGI
jgi:integrase